MNHNIYTTPPPHFKTGRLGGLNKYDVDKPYASINEILFITGFINTGKDKVNPVSW